MSLILVRLLVKLAHTTGSQGQRCISNLDLVLASLKACNRTL
jgi:hypothetical protein